MKKALTTSLNSFVKQSKFNQFNQVFKAFSNEPKTMLMVSIETGICTVSKHRAGFYTTNLKNLCK